MGEWVAFMSYNVPQTRPICAGCYGGLTNKTCIEPKLQGSPADGDETVKQRVGLSDWDPTYMSWAPADGARTPSAWSTPVLVGAPVPQMDTNFAAVIDDDGRLVGMWRDHYRDAAGTKAKSTIHLVTASDWKDNATYVFEHDDLLFSGEPSHRSLILFPDSPDHQRYSDGQGPATPVDRTRTPVG